MTKIDPRAKLWNEMTQKGSSFYAIGKIFGVSGDYVQNHVGYYRKDLEWKRKVEAVNKTCTGCRWRMNGIPCVLPRCMREEKNEASG